MIGTREDAGRDVGPAPVKRRVIGLVQHDRRSKSPRGIFDGKCVTGAR